MMLSMLLSIGRNIHVSDNRNESALVMSIAWFVYGMTTIFCHPALHT